MSGRRTFLALRARRRNCPGPLLAHASDRQGASRAPPTPDLGVADVPGLARPGLDAIERPPARPGILVAWRNTEKILETEVRLRNRGTTAAQGRLSVEILDADHKVLHARPDASQPFMVEVPAADRGGDVGILVQVPGTLEMNRTLDTLDRTHSPYCIRVTVLPVGADGNPADNLAVKGYNSSARLGPEGAALHQFSLVNSSGRELRGRIHYEGRRLPASWTMAVEPAEGATRRIGPGETVRGSVVLRRGVGAAGAAFADVRPVLVADSGAIIDRSEFFVAADDSPPRFTEASAAPGPAGRPGSVYVQVRAADTGSGVAEASGASVVFSTDAGRSYASAPLTYADGNFTAPTGFDGTLGPFPDGTTVTLFAVVRDVVGNETTTRPVALRLPLTQPVDLR